ncbi:hypothetical protein VAEKB19_6310006 [Vibrio aestuarianus]|nr:hypothetical protein VAEKB19_6310006 [Vibrio aestuarianus]
MMVSCVLNTSWGKGVFAVLDAGCARRWRTSGQTSVTCFT